MVTRAERVRRALLDWGCTLLGFGIIGHQVFWLPPGQASGEVLWVALALLTGPAGIAVISRLRNGGGDTTVGPSSSPPPPSGSLPSSSQSAQPEAAEA